MCGFSAAGAKILQPASSNESIPPHAMKISGLGGGRQKWKACKSAPERKQGGGKGRREGSFPVMSAFRKFVELGRETSTRSLPQSGPLETCNWSCEALPNNQKNKQNIALVIWKSRWLCFSVWANYSKWRDLKMQAARLPWKDPNLSSASSPLDWCKLKAGSHPGIFFS